MQSKSENYVIAIDGVSGSGKSTTAKRLAHDLDILHLDTGAMYRMVTYAALQAGISVENEIAVIEVAEKLAMDFNEQGKFVVNNKAVGNEIRSPEVNAKVSDYCKIPKVRQILVDSQRMIGSRRSCVAEGRDTATVVFPQAEFKFFLSARPEIRAKRRLAELLAKGLGSQKNEVLEKDVLENLMERDQKDSTRKNSPLMIAPGAREIDTSDLTIDEQVAIIREIVQKNLQQALHV